MSLLPHIESLSQELAATQQAAEDLLRSIAAGDVTLDTHSISRLDKLAVACARLAYANGLITQLSDNVESLIRWCDHLDDPGLTADFVRALKTFPLRSPW